MMKKYLFCVIPVCVALTAPAYGDECGTSGLGSNVSGRNCTVSDTLNMVASGIVSNNIITINAGGKIQQTNAGGIQIQSSPAGTPTLNFQGGILKDVSYLAEGSNGAVPVGHITISHGTFKGAINIFKGTEAREITVLENGVLIKREARDRSMGNIEISGGTFNFTQNSTITMREGSRQIGSYYLKGGNFNVAEGKTVDIGDVTHMMEVTGGKYDVKIGGVLNLIADSMKVQNVEFSGDGYLVFGGKSVTIDAKIEDGTNNLGISSGGSPDGGVVVFKRNTSVNSLKYHGSGTTLAIDAGKVITIKKDFNMSSGNYINAAGGIKLFEDAGADFDRIENLGFLEVGTGTVNFFAGSENLGILNFGSGVVNFKANFVEVNQLNLQQGTLNVHENITTKGLDFGTSGKVVLFDNKTLRILSDMRINGDTNSITGKGILEFGALTNMFFTGTEFKSDLLTISVGEGAATFNAGLSTFSSLKLGRGTANFNGNATVEDIGLGVLGENTVGRLNIAAGVTLTSKHITTQAGGSIQGAGTLKLAGEGAISKLGTLNGTLNHLGKLIIENGNLNFNGNNDTLQNLTVGNNGTATITSAPEGLIRKLTLDSLGFEGTGEIIIQKRAILALKQSTASGSANLISGDGTLQLLGGADITFGSSAGTLGGLIIGSGTATISDHATLGNVLFERPQGGTLSIVGGKILTVSSSITTSGTNLITGSGTLKLSGEANGYFGASISELGTLDIDNGTATFLINSSLSNVKFSGSGSGKVEIAKNVTVTIDKKLELEPKNAIVGEGTLNLSAADATLNTGGGSLGALVVGSGTATFTKGSVLIPTLLPPPTYEDKDPNVGRLSFASSSGGKVSINAGTILTIKNLVTTSGSNEISGTGTLSIADGAGGSIGADLGNLENFMVGKATVNFFANSSLQNFSFASTEGGILNITSGYTLTMTKNFSTSGTNKIKGEGTLQIADGKTATFGSSITELGNLRVGSLAEVTFNENSSIGNIAFTDAVASKIVIAQNKVLNVTNSISLLGSNRIDGSGTLNLVGGAVAHYATDQNFTGTINVGAGRLNIGQTANIKNITFASGNGGIVDIASGKTLGITGSIFASGGNTIQGLGTLELVGTAFATFGGNITSLASLKVGSGRADFENSATIEKLSFSGSDGTVNISARKALYLTQNVTTTGTNVISGDGFMHLSGGANGTFGADIAGLGGIGVGSGVATFNGNATLHALSFNTTQGQVFIGNTKKVSLGSDFYMRGNNALEGLGTLEMRGSSSIQFDSSVDFGGNLSIDSGKIRLNKNVTVGKIDINTGVLDIDANHLTTNNLTFANGGTLVLRMKRFATDALGNADPNNFGHITSNAVTVASGKVDLKILIDYGVVTKPTGTEFQFISGGVNADQFNISNNRYSFVNTNCVGGLCYNVVQSSTASDVVIKGNGNQNQSSIAKAFLEGQFFAEGTKLFEIASHLDNLSQHNSKGYMNALTALAPDMTGGSTQLPMTVQSKVFNVVSMRMNSVQGSFGQINGRAGGSPYDSRWIPSGDYFRKAGYTDEVVEPTLSRPKYQKATPNDADYFDSDNRKIKRRVSQRRKKAFGLWVQAFANTSELFSSSDPLGFSGDTTGISLGFDTEVWDNVVLGGGYANTKTTIDALQRTSDVSGDSFFLYGMYKPSDWFMTSMLSYTKSSSDETKDISGIMMTDSYDSSLWGLQVVGGKQIGNWRPAGGLKISALSQDAHQDSIGQQISSVSNTVLTALTELRWSEDIFLKENTYWRPEVSVALGYDLVSDKNKATVNLPNGSFYSVEGEGLDKLSMEAGVGVSYLMGNHIDLSIGYNGEFRKDFTSHTGMIRMRYDF